MPEHAEEAPECALCVPTEGGGEDDDVALVALHVFYVLDEESHVFAALHAITFAGERIPEGTIAFSPAPQHFFNEVSFFTIEGYHADSRRRSLLAEPQVAQHIR